MNNPTNITMKEVEQKLFPLAKSVEESGRWEVLQGVLLAAIALCDLSEEDMMNVVAKLNVTMANQIIASRLGNDKILSSVGLTPDKIAHIEALAKQKDDPNA